MKMQLMTDGRRKKFQNITHSMEVVTGALPSVITKLGDLLAGEFNLHKGARGEIRFLQVELESMRAALGKHSDTPADQLDVQDRIWARDLRELSYDIEDAVDTFMVHHRGRSSSELTSWPRSLKEFIHRSCDLLSRFQARRRIATEIRDIKRRVVEVGKRRERYKVIRSGGDAPTKPVTVDPRLSARYEKVTNLVGIERARDEVIEILMGEGETSMEQGEAIVSIVGFGGLGKTTLANAVYERLRAQFDCSAFVSVSRTPDLEKLFGDMLYQLAKKGDAVACISIIDKLREFLEKKRYLIIIDDLWDISVWKIIKCALPENNCGYRIITTTRILNVAEQVGGTYKLKPLSVDNSKKLLYRRIFGQQNNDDRCPDKELVEISNRILNKCAGVPLAIITIASLLASKGRNKMVWYEVFNSIGTGLGNGVDVENMRKILSFSYYDLPSNVRTCLLYLSVFPEDCTIEKDRLIWMWIAEGFIQFREKGKSLFELGESYFNELINRSMIQSVYDGYNAMIKYCQVHDMILDLIRSLSSEENFVSILNDVNHTSLAKKVWRLSLQQHSKVDHATDWDTLSMQQVRSVVAFPSAFHLMPALPRFSVLHVLDLDGCDLSQGYSLMYLGNLRHLRYLGLRHTRIAQIPAEIGSMQFLQTLDTRCNEVCILPPSVVQLRGLMCLRISNRTSVPIGIGSLTSLEELSTLSIYNDSISIVIGELSHLTELRVLDIVCQTEQVDSTGKQLVELLRKLLKIQSLDIVMYGGDCNLDGWVVAPPHIRRVRLERCWFSTLPVWVKPSLLQDLSFLWIAVRELTQEDLETLGGLPALAYLNLKVDHENLGIAGRFCVDGLLFPCLVFCSLCRFGGPLVFRQGAMPRLTSLRLTFLVRRNVGETIGGDNCVYNLGLSDLQSLQDVIVRLRFKGAGEEEVEEATAAVRHAAETHPNHCSDIETFAGVAVVKTNEDDNLACSEERGTRKRCWSWCVTGSWMLLRRLLCPALLFFSGIPFSRVVQYYWFEQANFNYEQANWRQRLNYEIYNL
ncbi:hypothetical protein U9M48_001554 [Paspalum notatum var. saurae]|uniref:Uncharacterized protein n=1 Tax=Paspalum notatum var. saurae TaxID=547442 RepID=A0AAQ3PPM5_PASNO